MGINCPQIPEPCNTGATPLPPHMPYVPGSSGWGVGGWPGEWKAEGAVYSPDIQPLPLTLTGNSLGS